VAGLIALMTFYQQIMHLLEPIVSCYIRSRGMSSVTKWSRIFSDDINLFLISSQ